MGSGAPGRRSGRAEPSWTTFRKWTAALASRLMCRTPPETPPLEDRDGDSQGRADRQQVHHAGSSLATPPTTRGAADRIGTSGGRAGGATDLTMTMRTRARAVAGCLIVSLSLAGLHGARKPPPVSDWSIEPTVVPAGAADPGAVRCRRLSGAVSCATLTAAPPRRLRRRPPARGCRPGGAMDGHSLGDRAHRPAHRRTGQLPCRVSRARGPRTCTAVGFANDADGTQAPLAER